MLAQSLCELAEHVGLSQSAMARHLGVERSNVSYWARGHREVPERHRQALLDLVFAKAKKQAALAKTWPLGSQRRRHFFRRLLPLVLECRAENLAAHGLADSVSVRSLVEQIDRFKTMPARELLKSETAQKLAALSRGLAAVAMIDAEHASLMELAEELKDATTDAFEPETSR